MGVCFRVSGDVLALGVLGSLWGLGVLEGFGVSGRCCGLRCLDLWGFGGLWGVGGSLRYFVGIWGFWGVSGSISLSEECCGLWGFGGL